MPDSNDQPQVTTQESQEAPKDDKSRTQEQFEKLTDSNKELKEQLEQEKKQKEELAKQHETLLESLKPKSPPQAPQQYQNPVNHAPSANQFSNLNQQQVNDAFQSMVDQDGYLDGNKLMSVLQGMNQRAIQAEQRAQSAEQRVQKIEKTQEDFEESKKMQAVHEKFPQLDPNNENFDEDFFDSVRNEMIGQMMKGEEDPMKAAEKWHKKLYGTKQEEQKAKEAENDKIDVNVARPRSTMVKGYYERDNQDALIQQVRQGKKGALAEALRRAESSR